MNNEYLDLVEKNRKKLLKLTKKQYREIIQIYKEASKELEIKAMASNRGSLTETFIVDYKKQVDTTIKELNKILYKSIKKSMKESANLPVELQLSFLNLLDKKYDLDITSGFNNTFNNIHTEVLKELLSLDFYKDGKGLSQRVWINGNKFGKDIDYIIKQGIAQKKSSRELAKDLEKYINLESKKDMDWDNVYPNLKGKKVDFNAFRLAQTSINYAYQLTLFRSCKKNPFVEGIQWRSALNERTC